jgi:cytochrome c5
MNKLLVIALMVFATGAWANAAPEKYQSTCFACHSTGAAGAPKTGDAAAWEPRMAKGMDVLVGTVKKGMNAMPPTGLCGNCSDEEYEALIEFMAAPAK